MIRISQIRPVLPILLGTCLGITLNMMFAPFLDDICDPSVSAEQDTENLIKLRETMSVDEKKPVAEREVGVLDAVQQDLLMPITNRPPNPQKPHKKFVRPRFASTELGIREKLFVVVMSSPNTVNSFGVAVNKTMAHYVTKAMFFTNSKPVSIPTGMSVVSFADHNAKHLPIHVLKYISDHYAQSFDYYMFMTDRTYIRAEKMFELLSHISVSQNVYMGSPDIHNTADPNMCSLEGGIIISQSVMARILSQLDWCVKNAHSSNPSLTFAKCVNHAADMTCVETVGDKVYKHYKVDDFDYDDDIDTLRGDGRFNASLSVFPMPDDISHYKIHRYYCQLELNLTRQEIEKAKENIVHLSQFAPGGRDSLTWPIGVPEPVSPGSRFDVIRWAYFTETHIYFDDDFSNVRKLQGVDKTDVQEILQTAFEKINRQYGYIFSNARLINGYRRFEPTRGMEYTLDLEFHKKNKRDVTLKRIHLLRPLGKVEIVPMPYVTENTRINLILPLYEADIEEFPLFMDGYFKNIFEKNDNSFLDVVFIYQTYNRKTKKDVFATPKSTVEFYLKKMAASSGKVKWKTFEAYNKSVNIFDVLDRAAKDLPLDALVCLCTPGMELEVEYLNRVRMNTIREYQVYFPISYWQYKPNLAYDDSSVSSGVEIGQKYGHFDVHSYEHNSFYLSDYFAARKQVSFRDLGKGDIYDMFLKHKKLNIFRAAEPALRHRWKKLVCSQGMTADQYIECLDRNAKGLASRSQMARLIFEYQENGLKRTDIKQTDRKDSKHAQSIKTNK